ncbi:oplophorus-luciferin 2-monooxygenase non-catalytic subunit-like isoform X2 [Homarus americanus]|uniref:oplophorus-luciferin 2-monooxygenase non-catalytic subunit-like isoform X2 n=1 Tax=Homarus americanus TaxID=6706 RepID=UPI001C450E9F|nr:oplophorus-luciferin 2-monooxygenase non-catalytic subunit-like isoform X2 [Homarus americanus]
MAARFINVFVLVLMVRQWTVLVSAEECPYYMDILPCVCTQDKETLEVDLNCSRVVDIEQLKQIFEAEFPSINFRELTMDGTAEDPVPLDYLPDGVFGPVTFRKVNIRYTNVQDIGDNVLLHLNSTLEELRLNDNELLSFPTADLPHFPKLLFLDISSNNLTFIADLHSLTLNSLNLGQNPGLFFTTEAFVNVPNLVDLDIGNCSLKSLQPNLFTEQWFLATLNLQLNHITELDASSLNFPNNSLNEIILSGTSGELYLVMMENQLQELRQEVWQPVFQAMADDGGRGFVVLDGNPLVCGCSIGWLVASEHLLKHLAKGAKCNNGTSIFSLDPDYYTSNCY